MKQLQYTTKTYETLEVYICNIGERRLGRSILAVVVGAGGVRAPLASGSARSLGWAGNDSRHTDDVGCWGRGLGRRSAISGHELYRERDGESRGSAQDGGMARDMAVASRPPDARGKSVWAESVMGGVNNGKEQVSCTCDTRIAGRSELRGQKW
jgi:hypothetical protein